MNEFQRKTREYWRLVPAIFSAWPVQLVFERIPDDMNIKQRMVLDNSMRIADAAILKAIRDSKEMK